MESNTLMKVIIGTILSGFITHGYQSTGATQWNATTAIVLLSM